MILLREKKSTILICRSIYWSRSNTVQVSQRHSLPRKIHLGHARASLSDVRSTALEYQNLGTIPRTEMNCTNAPGYSSNSTATKLSKWSLFNSTKTQAESSKPSSTDVARIFVSVLFFFGYDFLPPVIALIHTYVVS